MNAEVRLLTRNVALNVTIVPLMLVSVSDDPSLARVVLIVLVFWPAFLISAAVQTEAGEWAEPVRKKRYLRLTASVLTLPLVVFLTLLLNPSIAVLLDDPNRIIAAAVVAGGVTPAFEGAFKSLAHAEKSQA